MTTTTTTTTEAGHRTECDCHPEDPTTARKTAARLLDFADSVAPLSAGSLAVLEAAAECAGGPALADVAVRLGVDLRTATVADGTELAHHLGRTATAYPVNSTTCTTCRAIGTHTEDCSRHLHTVTASSTTLTPSTPPPAACAPWCKDGDGHPTENRPDDQWCSSSELRIGLGVDRYPVALMSDGSYERDYLSVYVTRDNGAPVALVNVNRGTDPGEKLSATEARQLGEALIRAADAAVLA